MESKDRELLLAAARNGDRAALGVLLNTYRPYVRVLVHALRAGRAPQRLDDSDLTQDVFLEAHRCFPAFRGQTLNELIAWLRQIVLHSAGHVLRGQLQTGKRNPELEDQVGSGGQLHAPSGSSPSAHAIQNEHAVLMAEALDCLPRDMQIVLLGRHLEDRSYADLAQQLGRTEAAVRVLYTRSLRKLREEFEKLAANPFSVSHELAPR